MADSKLRCYMPDLGRLLEQLPKNWGRWERMTRSVPSIS